MKHDHIDILYMEKAARRRGMSLAQLQAAIRAYSKGGYPARALLHSLGLLPKAPEKPKEMDDDELQTLRGLLETNDTTTPPDIPGEPQPMAGTGDGT